ncbi:MAG: 3-oxoacyl-(acyl-carrier-protein) synthase [Firmicutes bacterium]|nr:3-oxoacyl-(acyl-carrier-protein) synthase [Bacillota bacterium]
MDKKNAAITGVGICVPNQVLTNDEVAKYTKTTAEWIESRTGISKRRIASPEQAASDLGVIAAEQALTNAGLSAKDVDLIIAATATPDMLFPATACIIQHKLGLKNTAAFDLEAGCSGFIYALNVGSHFITSGQYRTVLVIGTEVLSRLLDWEDRETSVIMGDGAGAVVLQPALPGYGILSCCLGADGSGGEYLRLPAGGSRMPITHQAIDQKMHLFKMNGPEVFRFAMQKVPEAINQVLALSQTSLEEVSLIVPHQANLRILEAVARVMDISMDKFIVNMDRYGNTSSASIPIALYEALAEGRINHGDHIVLTGFGAGLTWGSIHMCWQAK